MRMPLRTMILVILACMREVPAAAATPEEVATAEVRQFYEDFERTINSERFLQDMSLGLAYFDLTRLRVFDILAPGELRGEDFRRHFLLTTSKFPAKTVNRALEIHAAANIAFASYLQICTGNMADGTPFEMRLRVTDGLEKSAGRWRIVHENISVPLDGPTLLKLMNNAAP